MVANPRVVVRCVQNGRMCYIGIGHRALLPVGCFGKCGAGRCELPVSVRIMPWGSKLRFG